MQKGPQTQIELASLSFLPLSVITAVGCIVLKAFAFGGILFVLTAYLIYGADHQSGKVPIHR